VHLLTFILFRNHSLINHSLIKPPFCLISLDQWCVPSPHSLAEASSLHRHSLARSIDRIIPSTPCATVATETLCVRVYECVWYCWGIGCRGLDAFQSNLLLGCGGPPSGKGRKRESGRRRVPPVGADCIIMLWCCLDSAVHSSALHYLNLY